jgi:molybdopterin converting factor small subunit
MKSLSRRREMALVKGLTNSYFCSSLRNVEERDMKIKLKFFGFPEVEKKVGGKEINLDLDGSTYGDLLNYLQKTYGESTKKTLGQQILRNGKEWIRRDDLAHSLQDGDQLSFLRMVSGG